MGKGVAVGLACYLRYSAKLNDRNGSKYLFPKDAHSSLKKDQLEGISFLV
jgi:hypothetical protein